MITLRLISKDSSSVYLMLLVCDLIFNPVYWVFHLKIYIFLKNVLSSPVCLISRASVCLLFLGGSFGSHVISDASAFCSHGSASVAGWSLLALAYGVSFLMCCTIFWLWTHALWNFIWEFFEAWIEVTFFQRGCVFTFTRSLETLQTQIHLKLNVQPWLLGFHSLCTWLLISPDFSFLVCC